MAELLRGAGRVGDEQHGHVLVGDDAVDPLAALLRELAVADGQRLVHHQDVRADRRHEREAQTGAHTARIRAHRLVDVLAEFRELHDLGNELLGLLFRQTPQLAAHVDVLHARQLHVEARGKLQQRGHAPVHLDGAGRREAHAGDHLERRGLAGAVVAEQRQGFAAVHGETQVVARVDRIVRNALGEGGQQAQLVVLEQLVLLGDVVEAHGDGIARVLVADDRGIAHSRDIRWELRGHPAPPCTDGGSCATRARRRSAARTGTAGTTPNP